MATPATRYAQTADGVSIAYQTLGEGPTDVVLLRMWHTNLEHDWEERILAQMFRRVAGFARLILFDRRGPGSRTRSAPTCRDWTRGSTTSLRSSTRRARRRRR